MSEKASSTRGASRRSVLAGLVVAAAGAPVLSGLSAGVAHATSANDTFASNTELYRHFLGTAETTDGEGVDFARRFKRHDLTDFDKAGTVSYPLTTVLAIHGGGIEVGTSELCLGVAGYDPNPDLPSGTPLFTSGPLYDFWMFEGLRTGNQTYPDGSAKLNSELHVTSIHCDDHVALSMAASSLNTLSLHGCTWEQANPGKTSTPGQDRRGVVVGGRSTAMRNALTTRLKAAGFTIYPGDGDVNGDAVENICNRTMTDGGGQLELTRELRDSFFGNPSGATNRGRTYNEDFKRFVGACRSAIADVEAPQRTARLLA
ncbi:poly-gamma-glutamate hydrolase family protein [Streptomyces sp. ISL-36]|uniref:poly-gamma-glutamate hydrolase family protein n=1 Tax=Streptomyces sp. ISL-36 TaxID=2819182 RepID=UPI001BE7BDC5|nr:poly-gamma-glutamate hydrolase family protein [Streptomyces sp. ISL-36]MBT2441778.1 poly-gamma-glutamate hydrolase family protein [Streptomyces sp. ISL-36]